MSCYRDLNPGPLPYQGSALPLSYNSKEEKRRAEDGTQTRDPQLGRLMLYQLSYFRNFKQTNSFINCFILWAVMDSNHRSRKTAELQSAPFGHSGICPFVLLRRFVSQLRCKDTTIYLNSKQNRSFLLQKLHIHLLCYPVCHRHDPLLAPLYWW